MLSGIVPSVLQDAFGSTIGLVGVTASIATSYTYEPFGAVTTSGSSNTSAYKFTGREDDGTGLYYYRARYYHPRFQRFLSQDPIDFAGGDSNLYAYVLNDPVNLIDPTGLFSWACFQRYFENNLNETNDFFFSDPTRLSRTALGAMTSGGMARTTGLTNLGMAARALAKGGGVANLGVGGTIASVVATA